MTSVKGMVQGFEETVMKVVSDYNVWYEFPIPSVRPLLGERVAIHISEGTEPELVMLNEKPLTQLEASTKLYRYDQIEMERLQTAADVTDEQIQRFWERGYMVIDQLLTPDEVAAALTGVDDIVQGRIEGPRVQYMKNAVWTTPEEREMVARKLHKFVDFSPALHHACFHPEGLEVLGKIFGESAKFLEDQAILKPPSPDAGLEKPWHQDMAYGNLSQSKMVCGVWIALDEATLENGCMHVIPGSHRDGPVPHFAIRDWQICDAHVDVEHDKVVPLKPGGALFFAGLLHHGTPPNFSNSRRRALQFHYCPESSSKLTPQQFKEMFTSEMSDAEC
ncbi:MAG: phytanoyl-CoA dioxygenase family protein [Paenibacillus sp.]|nr:phytanoyl-CoA dioxygenase family protein [Paenibacillus sp.]